MLVVSARQPGIAGLIVAAIPTGRSGITVNDDWDNIGQRQTDSGSVRFECVAVSESELLRQPGPLGSTFASLRSCLAQLILANIYLGLAEGALEQARRFLNELARPWVVSSVKHAAEDPFVLRNVGEYWVETAAARALTDAAQRTFQEAFDLGDEVTDTARGRVAIDIATAKVASARAALNVSSRMFEALGARSTAARLAFDRFWRNARTHTLHDPLDYKLHELGAYCVTGQAPKPSFYS